MWPWSDPQSWPLSGTAVCPPPSHGRQIAGFLALFLSSLACTKCMPPWYTLQELIFMSHAYTVDQLVEQPAIGLFAELGWTTVSALEEIYGSGGTLGRETTSEAVLVSRLRPALQRLNPALPPEAITLDRKSTRLESSHANISYAV